MCNFLSYRHPPEPTCSRLHMHCCIQVRTGCFSRIMALDAHLGWLYALFCLDVSYQYYVRVGNSIFPSWPSFTQLLLRTANSMHLKYMIGCWTCMCHDTCFHIKTNSCVDRMNAIKSREFFWKVFVWCVNAVNKSEYWTWQKRLWWIQADDGLSVHFERTAWENMRSNVSSIPWKDENDVSFIIPLKWPVMWQLCVRKKVFESECYFSQNVPPKVKDNKKQAFKRKLWQTCWKVVWEDMKTHFRRNGETHVE